MDNNYKTLLDDVEKCDHVLVIDVGEKTNVSKETSRVYAITHISGPEVELPISLLTIISKVVDMTKECYPDDDHTYEEYLTKFKNMEIVIFVLVDTCNNFSDIITGAIVSKKHYTAGNTANIDAIATNNIYRRQGYGDIMMAFIVHIFVNVYYNHVRLTVDVKPGLEEFYEGNCFEPIDNESITYVYKP